MRRFLSAALVVLLTACASPALRPEAPGSVVREIDDLALVAPALAEADRVRLVSVPANEIADSLGNIRMANMVALGAFIEATGVLPLAVVEESLSHVIAKHYSHLIPKNAEALRAGANAAKG